MIRTILASVAAIAFCYAPFATAQEINLDPIKVATILAHAQKKPTKVVVQLYNKFWSLERLDGFFGFPKDKIYGATFEINEPGNPCIYRAEAELIVTLSQGGSGGEVEVANFKQDDPDQDPFQLVSKEENCPQHYPDEFDMSVDLSLQNVSK